jgi:hypothetical protein
MTFHGCRNARLPDDNRVGLSKTKRELEKQLQLLNNLPETCEVHPGLKIYVVPEDDPLKRSELVGELGVLVGVPNPLSK